MKKLQQTVLLAATAVFLGTGIASAKDIVTKFQGTRDQVRAACVGDGYEVIEGGNSTTCLDHINGSGVSCGDDGNCAGSYPESRDNPFAIMGFGYYSEGGGKRPPMASPQSLSDNSSVSDAAPTPIPN